MVIFDINPDELNYSINNYERLSSLLPYYKSNSVIKPVVESRSPFEKVKLVSSIYPFNSILLTILVGNLEFNIRRKGDIRGYVPIFKETKQNAVVSRNIKDGELDNLKIEAITQIIKQCQKERILLVFVQSPSLIYENNLKSGKFLESYFHNKKTIYFNYEKDPLFMGNIRYFADAWHLNDYGARCFSQNFVREIRMKTRIN